MKRAAIVIVVLAGLGAGAYAVVSARTHGDRNDGVTTYVVKKEKFVRHVTAEGNLQAVKATPIITPQNGGYGPMKIAWVVPDGSAVKQGDVVVKFDPTDSEKRLQDSQADLSSANALFVAPRPPTPPSWKVAVEEPWSWREALKS